jgi:hypothetical protein
MAGSSRDAPRVGAPRAEVKRYVPSLRRWSLAGDAHTDAGEVYTFGANESGQLGCRRRTMQCDPVLLDALQSHVVGTPHAAYSPTHERLCVMHAPHRDDATRVLIVPMTGHALRTQCLLKP